ncbi:MAG: NAD-dependent epimerase/dehydratase family protein [Chloroflexi bacterium]|nr:NAD-dependent epimerase/dehydratase family protein [Chloroflexota bacterium]
MLNLVTGATGLVGSKLVEALLARGEEVRVLARPTSRIQHLRDIKVDVRIGTLNDNATLMAAARGVDRIFHCAGLVSDWGVLENFIQTNVHGTRNMLAAATRAEVKKFVFLSTTDVYGFPGTPAEENERPSPRGFPFADTKIEAEGLIWNHRRRVGLPVCVIRPATIYGPGAEMVVTRVVEMLRRRRMYLVDGGTHIMGLTHVSNLVDAMLLAADSEASIGQAYNISDGSKITWREYLYALADLTELPRPSRNYPRWLAFGLASFWETYYHSLGRTDRPPMTRMFVEYMGTDQDFPIAKAQRELGYQPRISFDEGLRQIGRWLRQTGLLDMREMA